MHAWVLQSADCNSLPGAWAGYAKMQYLLECTRVHMCTYNIISTTDSPQVMGVLWQGGTRIVDCSCYCNAIPDEGYSLSVDNARLIDHLLPSPVQLRHNTVLETQNKKKTQACVESLGGNTAFV